MTTRIKLRRDTAANWTTNDPVLALGEAGYDTTNNELRVGDGTTVWSGLESIGGTSDKITAEKTYSNNYSDGSEHTFAYTTGSIAVQIGNDNGLYLDDLLSRWAEYFDGNLAFPYNYSNINLVINPNTDDLASTVTNVTFSGSPPLYTITLGTAHPGPITIDDIDFNYNYINTIGLAVNGGEGGYFGMATGDDDITIRSGRDITLDAADDVYISGGNEFQLTLVNQDDMNASSGIEIRTETTSTDYTWTFRFDGNLELPEGLTLPTKTNTGYDYNTTLAGPTLRLSSDNQNQVIVTGPATTEINPYAQRIVIQGQRGFGTWSTSTVGEGGDVYIWGGTGGESNSANGGSGGDVKLRGGQGQNHDGGYVRIEGGNAAIYNSTSTGYGGFVEITGGDVQFNDGDASDPAKGGDVRITGGRAYTASTQSGIVQVITGGYTNGDVLGDKIWTFGNDGSLSLPARNGTTATTTGGVIKIKGSVRTLPGDIPIYGIPGTASFQESVSDKVIWTADSVLVTAAKITLRVAYYNTQATGWDNTEIIELLITKSNPGVGSTSTDANIAVIGRVKSNAAYADSTVDWDYDANNRLVLLTTLSGNQTADCNIYWNYDVVAFEHTLD